MHPHTYYQMAQKWHHMLISLFFSFTSTVTHFDEWRVTAKMTNYDKCLEPRWGNKTRFMSQLDPFNDGGKGQELGLSRRDLPLTLTTFLTWNGQTFSPDGSFTLALAVSPWSEAAICPVLGAGIPRLAVPALSVHHDLSGCRFPGGLHTTLVWFHYLQKEHLFSEDWIM